MSTRATYYSVGALAGATLMLESTLTRMLAVAQFYHFAFLVISLALLGFGASGSLLAIFPSWLRTEEKKSNLLSLERILIIAGAGFSISLGVAYLVINYLPFDSYSIAWDSGQVILFVVYYLVLTLPFIFAGLGIGVVLSSSPGSSNRVYAVNLIGSAAGIILGLLVMQLAGVPGALLVCGLVGLSAVFGARQLRQGWLNKVIWLLLIFGFGWFGVLTVSNQQTRSGLGITISPYKGLSYALRIPGAQRIFGAWNAFSRIDVITGASTHILPGLSYAYQGDLPQQQAMAFDGDALRPITMVTPQAIQAADFLPEASAFQLQQGGKVLVLEAGSGLAVLQAVAGGAGEVVAVLDNPLILSAIEFNSLQKSIYSHPQVRTQIVATRDYLAKDLAEFDVVFLPLSEPYRPVANGAYSLAENYQITVEAITAALLKLRPEGTFVVSRWLQTPPSEELRMLTTIIDALEVIGVQNPGESLVAYRGIQTMTYLVQPNGWQQSQLDFVRDFAGRRRFDLVWTADMQPEEANRFNKLETPVYYQLFSQFLEANNLQEVIQDYPYAVQPAVDDHPFFYHFFKWRQAPQVLATFGRVWQPFGGSGYFVLIGLLLLVSLFSAVLILIPLFIKRSLAAKMDHGGSIVGSENSHLLRWKVLTYFGSIGIAFLFLEIPLIQSSILSFGQPAYAFAFVVLVLLAASSLGSLNSRTMWPRRKLVMVLLLVFSICTPFLFRQLQYFSLGWVQPARILLLGVSLFPLGILMGVPFPFGLEWLERERVGLIPWAWAVNGCASVVAAVLAAIISLSSGYTAIFLLGALFYAVAAYILR